jgi:hypothetical protein
MRTASGAAARNRRYGWRVEIVERVKGAWKADTSEYRGSGVACRELYVGLAYPSLYIFNHLKPIESRISLQIISHPISEFFIIMLSSLSFPAPTTVSPNPQKYPPYS